MNRVFVLGSINCDLTINSDRLPQEGETLAGQNFLLNSGGKGANQAVACSKLGAKTYLIGAVGEDIFGQMCLRSLREYGCETDFVEKVPNVPTGVASIWVIGGENRILLERGANFYIDEERAVRVLERYARPGDLLVTQFEVREELAQALFCRAKELGMYTVLNPAPVPKKGGRGILRYTDLIVPNRSEAEALSGFNVASEEGLRRAAAWFFKQGVKEVFITLGKDGAYYSGCGCERRTGVFPAEAVDTTAAGDTTVGALAYRLAAGYTVRESMRFSAAASALAVSRSGAQRSIPVLSEVEALLGEKKEERA